MNSMFSFHQENYFFANESIFFLKLPITEITMYCSFKGSYYTYMRGNMDFGIRIEPPKFLMSPNSLIEDRIVFKDSLCFGGSIWVSKYHITKTSKILFIYNFSVFEFEMRFSEIKRNADAIWVSEDIKYLCGLIRHKNWI